MQDYPEQEEPSSPSPRQQQLQSPRGTSRSRAANPGVAGSTPFFQKLFRQPTNKAEHSNSLASLNRQPRSFSERKSHDDLTPPSDNENELQYDPPSFWRASSFRMDMLCIFLLKSVYWRGLIILLTVILLFGPEVRYILLPKEADPAMDVIFMVTFGLLWADIFVRMRVETGYFAFNVFGKCYLPRTNEDGSSRGIKIGSFIFWCEAISALAILYDISFVNKEHFDIIFYEIELNAFGIPRRGLETINEALPVERDLQLIVTIAKSLRVARFIRSTRAVKFSSKVNWHGLVDLRWWLSLCRPSKTNLVRRENHSLGDPELFHSSLSDLGNQQHFNGMVESVAQIDEVDTLSRSAKKRRNESQVGGAMRELTGQRVAFGIILSFVLTVLFSYKEIDTTRPSTMIVLHNQTGYPAFALRALEAARGSSVPDLYRFDLPTGETETFTIPGENSSDLRYREIVQIRIKDDFGAQSTGYFAYRNERRQEALVMLLSTIFILLVWFFGVTAFAGPVMTLVVIPIERMVRLLDMLMVDPLGYQSSIQYQRFIDEEDEITKNTRWTKEMLKGMETSFLMSTITRIGSLMKVGFGSAGVEIIRNNLEKGYSKNMLMLNSKGSTVSCIFLFCDIRSFTDCTECLQEEVFVFTNRIAAVVHSFCNAYGGSANKNVGDAFLLSWILDENDEDDGEGDPFCAKSHQADKALLSVVKICISLNHDNYYIEGMSEHAREALLTKLSKRKGPVVQMGFGLHAGQAVQGAIGSQRKIDATYVSEAVERAELLESSTKQYGLKMLMSHNFFNLLHPSNKRRCRKIDQIVIRDDEDDDEDELNGDIIELYTFDMDIDALWRKSPKGLKADDIDSDTSSLGGADKLPAKRASRSSSGMRSRRLSIAFRGPSSTNAEELSNDTLPYGKEDKIEDEEDPGPPELVLPTGQAMYNANVWVSDDMRRIRQVYSDGLFYQKFNSGLQSYYAKDWDHAKQCFQTILERIEDEPSRYFLSQIEKNNGIPPKDLVWSGR